MRESQTERFLLIGFILFAFFIVSPAPAAGTQTLISTLNSNWYHQLPKIYGDQIVWQDSDWINSYGIIYLYNITSGIETQITNNTTYTTNPAIYGNNIVWTDCGNYPACFNPSTLSQTASVIYLYNIPSGKITQISGGSDYQDYPAVFGNRIVWQDTNLISSLSQIYLNGTSPALAAPVSNSADNQVSPAIYGNLVVWVDYNSITNYQEIYLYNLTSDQLTQITSNPTGWDQLAPAISGNRIVWEDDRETAAGYYEIFINGTSPGNAFSLTPNEPSLIHQSPSISGTWVVWSQTNATTGNSDLFVNDTSSGQTTPIVLNLTGNSNENGDLNPSVSYSPSQSLYRIVWDEQDPSGYNVYLYTSGPTQTCPVASFTDNFAGGSAPLAGQFADTSTYSPANPITHWFWDFGDGSNSTLQNPFHTYSANGAYTVSLTVSNPLCRNTSTVANSVIVGQPVAGFTASPTSTVVNAPISFTDTSQGNPTQWNWSWGDGSWTNGTIKNPSHPYSATGLYTVTLIASNAYGSGSVTKPEYITVNPGMSVVENTTINGITIQNPGGRQYLVYNYATLPLWTFNPDSSVLDFEPPGSSGFHNISITTSDAGGFTVFPGNTTIAGTISEVHLQTNDITPTGFSAATGGPFCSVNYSVNLTAYPVNALLDTQMWQGATASDENNFISIASGSRYSLWNQTAYTVKVFKTNFPAGGTAVLHMSLNASWVASKPFGINEVFFERIDDSGTYGQVLGTHFLYYNPTSNLDYFEADSPNGLSTFGLSFLEGAGNLFQLITLTVSNQMTGSNGGSSESGPAVVTPAVVQTTAVPLVNVSPSQPDTGKTANLYINANSVITQATTLTSTDNRATITLGKGVIAKDRDGNVLPAVTIKAVPSAAVPDLPQGSAVSFAGVAYELGPDGATFSPGISFAITYPEARWNQVYTLKEHDPITKTWVDLPTVYAPESSTITASISHFCCFGLFSETKNQSLALKAPPESQENTPPAPALPAPPTTAVNIFIDMIVWVFGLALKNLIVLGIAVVLVLVYYLMQRKKRMDRIRYML